MIRGKLFLLLLVTGLAVAVHADYKQSLKNRKLMTEEPIPVGSHAVDVDFGLPLDENFNSASFRDELANALGVPVDSVRITSNNVEQEIVPRRVVGVAIIDLTTAQEAEVSAFFDDNLQFTLDGFGTVTTINSNEVAKSKDTVRLLIQNVCTSVSATNFPEADYIEAFDNALESTASVTTSIDSINAFSPECDDANPPGTTQVETRIEVPAADLGAVLDLLPMASSTIDLGGDFGEVSLGNTLLFFIN